MLSVLHTLFFFVLALGILVAVHEWGHFWVARRCGVKVERFSIGFGKALWRTHDKLGTEYVVAMIPLGGYVKMLDERVDVVADKDLDKTFNRQSVGKRMAIIAAGPITNFIFAVLALALMFMLGVERYKPVIETIKPESVMAQAKISSPAQIVAVDGVTTTGWQEVNLEFGAHIGSQAMTLTLKDMQDGHQYQRTVDLKNWHFDPDKHSPITSLGIQPYFPGISTRIAQVAENSPAERANLQQNDKIIALDGTPVEDWEQIVSYIAARPNQNVTIGVQRQGNTQQIDVRLDGRSQQGEVKGYLGVIPTRKPWPASYRFSQQYDPFNAFWQGMVKTWRLMRLSVDMVGKFVSGDVSVKNLSGPIAIAQGAGASAGYGLVAFLGFLALISVNLGIINLLPLPILDGGHLLYLLIEWVRGKPVPEKVQELGFRIGGALLLALMTVAIMNDIARL